jgi:hypothetical protein
VVDHFIEKVDLVRMQRNSQERLGEGDIGDNTLDYAILDRLMHDANRLQRGILTPH